MVMRDRLGHVPKLLNLAVAGLCVAAGLVLDAPGATAATTSCTGTVQISAVSFSPPVISAGQTSTVTLVAQNCTDQSVRTTVQYQFTWLSPSGTSLPPGCPVNDPVAESVTFAPGATYTSSRFGVTAFPGCTATGERVTVSIFGNGATLATRTADLALHATASCAITYRSVSEWSSGFVAQVTIANTGSTPIDNWSLAFSFPGDQRIASAWNASVSQTASAVTAAALPYDQTVPAGGSITIGFLGTWHASDAPPTAFTLNDGACATT